MVSTYLTLQMISCLVNPLFMFESMGVLFETLQKNTKCFAVEHYSFKRQNWMFDFWFVKSFKNTWKER